MMLVTRQKVLRRFWYATLPLSALADGPRAFTLLGEPLVLWQDGDGRPVAMRDRCCHRTAQLSRGFYDNGRLACGYHGWAYDRTGRCVSIPQQPDSAIPSGARVASYACEARYGYAWVALEDPLQPIPDVPEAAMPGFRRIEQFDERWDCGALRMMENSFDNAHFSYVHRNTFGQYDQPKPSKYELWPTDWGFESESIVPINNPPHALRITGDPNPVTTRHLRNRWFMPFSRTFHATYPSGIQHVIFNCATPIDDGSIQLVQLLFRNDTEADCPAQALIDWDRAIVDEDRAILEATDPDAAVDTRRRVEFHMDSDRPGLLMRRKLMELLEQHGEAEVHR
jgi:phenylpropionate dioxygenase-like ring-hydroxylating dioxygenase large terminal subunit